MDEEYLPPLRDVKKVYQTPLITKYTFFLSDVEEREKYEDFLYVLNSASPDDIIEIIINSYGGFEDTAIQLYNAITSTNAQTIGVVTGYCCSAGTIVLLACDCWQVYTNSKLMVHAPSGGLVGKANETRASSEFEAVWLKEFFDEVYKGFLTDKEISAVIEGKDLWMTGREASKRLLKFDKERKAHANERLPKRGKKDSALPVTEAQ